MFFRPSIAKRLEDELYYHRRLLLDAEAKLLHANTLAAQQKVAVELLRDRVKELTNDVASVSAPIAPPSVMAPYIEGLG